MNHHIGYILIIISQASTLLCQSNWEVFSTIHAPQELELQDGIAYVTTGGGLLRINIEPLDESLDINKKDGLKALDVKEIEILEDGQMYISAGQGLHHYDGNSFVYYRSLPSGKSIDIPKSLVLNEGQLWFNLRGALISLLDGNFTEHDLEFSGNLLGHNFDSSGNLWIVSDSLSHFENEELVERVAIPNFNSNTNVNSYFIDSEDRHWLGVYLRGPQEYYILSYKNAEWQSFEIPSQLQKFFERSPGDISFSLRSMYGTISNDTMLIDSLSQLYPLLPPSNGFERILNFEDNDIPWIATYADDQENQLYRYDNGNVTVYGKNTSYHTSRPNSIAHDCSDIYVMESDQIQSYENGAWLDYNLNFNEECHFLQLATNNYDCKVWGYSDDINCNNLLWIEEGEIRIVDILMDDQCDAISFDPFGNLYSVCSGSLTRIDNLGLTHNYVYPDKVVAVYNVRYTTDGNLWVITNGESSGKNWVYQIKDDIWTRQESELLNTFDLNTDWSYEDKQGNLWLRESHALLKYSGSVWERYPVAFIQDLIQDIDGNYWVAMQLNGLAKWDLNNSESFVFYTKETSNISSNDCFELELIQDSLLWIRHLHGLTKMTLDLSTSAVEVEPYTTTSPYQLYPNPTSGRLTLTNPQRDIRQIEIYTTKGELVSSTVSDDAYWMTDLEAGVYWVKLSWDEGQAMEKVVVFEQLGSN